MLFLLNLFVYGVKSLTGLQTTTFSVNSEGTFNIIHCLFDTGSNLAISIRNSGSAILECYSTTFTNINTNADGTALSNDNYNCDLHFSLVCITDCKASSKGGAFYYNTLSHSVNPSFNYMTINNCYCKEHIIDIDGNSDSDLSFSNCNFTRCSQESSVTDLFYFWDYYIDIQYSTFEGNIAMNVLIVFAEWSKSYVTSNTKSCNIVYNKYSNPALLYINKQTCTLSNTIIRDNVGDYEIFGRLNNAQIILFQCTLQPFSTAGYSITSCTIGSEAYTTYAVTFYQTLGCHAEIPYLTPLKTLSIEYHLRSKFKKFIQF